MTTENSVNALAAWAPRIRIIFTLLRSTTVAALAVVALSACGGNSGAATNAAPAPVSKFGLIAYIGDDLTALGCDAEYSAPYPDFEADTPNAVCSAVQGETSAQTLARLPAVLDQRPHVIVILTGLNDIRNGAASTEAIIEMVNEAQAQGVIVILCALPTSAGFDTEIQAWNASIRKIAHTYGTQISDLYAGMANPAAVPDVAFNPWLETAPLMDPEGVYPNAAGFLVIWDVICVAADLDGVVAS